MLWKKTTPNDGSGFFPNVTVTCVATSYNRLAAELQSFPDRRILNFLSQIHSPSVNYPFYPHAGKNGSVIP